MENVQPDGVMSVSYFADIFPVLLKNGAEEEKSSWIKRMKITEVK